MQTTTYEEIVKIQPRGVLTIPSKFRKQLSIGQNDLFKIKEVKGALVLEPVRTLDYPVRSYTDNEIDEFIKLDQEESKRLKAKNLL